MQRLPIHPTTPPPMPKKPRVISVTAYDVGGSWEEEGEGVVGGVRRGTRGGGDSRPRLDWVAAALGV
ncbi:hypothetical protein Acr_00g0033210 [Actinidia rufa]|uniref:Uncharacterized protein n=1 Tax=Actinidia rufa TaxID=165716 RepID=A0A7J0DFK3_9ERIC|nr:hypothetical protein Acr_00g0033210 [Actinidia rufa]